MASADELIREALYALNSISHGSTDEKKNRARAEKYARRLIRKYPTTIEASQARQILERLNVRVDVRSPLGVSPQADAVTNFESGHSSDSGHTGDVSSMPAAFDSRFRQAIEDEDWRGILRRFMELPPNKKKILGIVAAVAIFFPGGIFAVSGLVVFYALQPALLKEHLNLLLKKLGSE